MKRILFITALAASIALNAYAGGAIFGFDNMLDTAFCYRLVLKDDKWNSANVLGTKIKIAF